MHSLRASSDLLISAPSRRVCRSVCAVSFPRSLPARSTNESWGKEEEEEEMMGVRCEESVCVCVCVCV